ncbi:MscL family protein [Nocardioides sp. TF02-7]|uniref:MscL family protein n=1 Tax=Nocardioides sp. TF02-7 TaxID=2917724 RepID=UPI001F069A6A|nr:MscL family protein [Nocardioides sp. TF02-7]UMG93731.1 MscL family protein [Nocardioides sp. TF02-7]
MDGFKNFLMRGNLIEIAVGLIMALAFTEVVTTFTDMLMGFIGKIGGQPDFSSAELAGVNVGLFINAVIAFLILGAVVYFLIVVPYTKAKARFLPEEIAGPTEVELLMEIRDSLAARGDKGV